MTKEKNKTNRKGRTIDDKNVKLTYKEFSEDQAERGILNKLENRGANFKHLNNFYNFCRQRGDSIKTIMNKIRVISYLLDFLKNKDAKKISRKDIERFLGHKTKNRRDKKKSEMCKTTLNYYKINIKIFFKYLYEIEEKGKYPKIVSWIEVRDPKRLNNENNIIKSESILTKSEIKSMIQNTNNLRNQALISVCYDGALRKGELLNLKIKDIEWDTASCKITVNGKTGQRIVRLSNSAPLLKMWINKHPFNNDKDRNVFICIQGKKQIGLPLSDCEAYNIIKKSAERVNIKKRVYPQLLRKSKLTHMAKDGFYESELRKFAGWTPSSSVVEKYVAIGDEYLDKKIKQKNGLLDEEELKRLKELEEKENGVLNIKICPMCKNQNDSSSKFCDKCGQVLDAKALPIIEDAKTSIYSLAKSDKELKKKIIEEISNQVLKELKKKLNID